MGFSFEQRGSTVLEEPTNGPLENRPTTVYNNSEVTTGKSKTTPPLCAECELYYHSSRHSYEW